jgi:hypothetical protein
LVGVQAIKKAKLLDEEQKARIQEPEEGMPFLRGGKPQYISVFQK